MNLSLILGKGQRFFSPPKVLRGPGFQSVDKWNGVTRGKVAGAWS